VLLRRALPLLVLCTACQQGDDGICESSQVTYHVDGTARMSELARMAGSHETMSAPGQLLLTVWEEQSIVSCHGDVVGSQVPGMTLVSDAVFAPAESFTLDVPVTIYPALGKAELYLHVLFDENENGRCDDREPTGGAKLPHAPASQLEVLLDRDQGCPARI
jgi:hypothetical protein